MNTIKSRMLVAGVALLATQTVLAADIDAQKDLICAAIEANDCALGTACIKSPAEDVNLPQFVRISVSENSITARGRTSKVISRSRADGMITMQGIENGRAWSITINEASGKLVAAIAGDDEGFLVFGACTTF